ncbi:MAG: hypothetical protein IAE77_23910 [Prosthecobacter sp.]|uniref:hypothetical protein n=1 Tax=Prosthecobacter sp. TaxID=1965333 RepID=UPI0019DFD7A1|nr:hypothetical protein [Prosthecobacter sp.]MBE2286524.1 hypothetical protein [Prosthecobacter sp.]
MTFLALAILVMSSPIIGREVLRHETPWTGAAAEVKWRDWMEKSVFPEFEFSGSLEDAIQHLMTASKKVTPDGRAVGSFVLRGEFDKIRVNIKLRGRNALVIIDSMCALADATWTLTPYSIIIQRDAPTPSK